MMAQPPYDEKLAPFFLLHYTYGMDYTLEGVFTPGEVGPGAGGPRCCSRCQAALRCAAASHGLLWLRSCPSVRGQQQRPPAHGAGPAPLQASMASGASTSGRTRRCRRGGACRSRPPA